MENMEFIFAGTGSAFTLKNYQTNTVIRYKDRHLLIDAGMDIRFALRDVDLSYKDIDAVYITHTHGDHVGGLEWLAYTTYFDPMVSSKASLIGDAGLLRQLWNETLQGGMGCLQGRQASLSDYFEVQMIKPSRGISDFIWNGLQFRIVRSEHIRSQGTMLSIPSYGLVITNPKTEKQVFYTGDCCFNPDFHMELYEQVNYIIQDCETYPIPSGVHANWLELKELPRSIKEKMSLVHFQDNVLTDDGKNINDEWTTKSINEGFRDFQLKGNIEIP